MKISRKNKTIAIIFAMFVSTVAPASIRAEEAVSSPEAATQTKTEAIETASVEADNTGVNERDRGGDTLTAQDQQQDELNLKLTQEIRQSIMDDDSLSFTAKNIKIISVDGEVTLRGPVNTQDEKQSIERHASIVPGVKAINNQLEVLH